MTRNMAILLLAAALSAACSSTVDGSATPDSSAPPLPPRPRELRIDGIDPCSALTPAQLKTLGVAFYRTVMAGDTRGPGCDWIHSPTEPVQSYTVDINTRGGVELVFGQPQLNATTIAGFGAVETPGLYSSGENDCVVNIDVAPRQAVQVAYSYNGSTVPMNHEIACQKARNAAELAMQTILARAGG